MDLPALRRAVAALTGTIALAIGACAEPADSGPWTCSREVQHQFSIVAPRQVDLLFVVDRSPSMADQAARLADSATEWAQVLEGLDGGMPDLHLAVVSADLGGEGVAGCTLVGDQARFVDGTPCGVDGRFVRDAPAPGGGRVDNHGGDLAGALTCLLDQPPSTCPVVQPLGAAVRALDGSQAGNDGFRRSSALLAVVVVSDGDDCSLIDRSALAGVSGADPEAAVDFACFALGATCQPADPSAPGLHTDCQPRTDAGLASVTGSLDALRALGGGRALVVVVAGAADPVVATGPTLEPSCTGDGVVGPAPRLAAVRGDHTGWIDACAASWADALTALGGYHVAPIGPCLPAGVDLEPTVPGVQAACAVTLIRFGAGGELVPLAGVPWCGDPGRDPDGPCYRLRDDSVECGDGAALSVDLGASPPLAYGQVEVRCQLACDAAP